MNDNKQPNEAQLPETKDIQQFRIPEKHSDNVQTQLAKPEQGKPKKRKKKKSKQNSETEKLTPKEMILLSVNEAISELWHDQNEHAFATIIEETLSTNLRINSAKFKSWARRKTYRKFNLSLSEHQLEEAIGELESLALFDGPQYQTNIRIAGDKEAIFLHLGNKTGRVIKITGSGVSDAKDALDARIKFLTLKGMLPLPDPEAPADIMEARKIINELTKFCNVAAEQWVLYIAMVLSAYLPCGPYVIAFFVGEQGSSKTTTCRFTRKLIDPNEVRN